MLDTELAQSLKQLLQSPIGKVLDSYATVRLNDRKRRSVYGDQSRYKRAIVNPKMLEYADLVLKTLSREATAITFVDQAIVGSMHTRAVGILDDDHLGQRRMREGTRSVNRKSQE